MATRARAAPAATDAVGDILTVKSNIGPREGSPDRIQEDTAARSGPHDRASVKAGHRTRRGIVAAEPSTLNPFDFREPFLRYFDHLPEAPQDVRVEDRCQRT